MCTCVENNVYLIKFWNRIFFFWKVLGYERAYAHASSIILIFKHFNTIVLPSLNGEYLWLYYNSCEYYYQRHRRGADFLVKTLNVHNIYSHGARRSFLVYNQYSVVSYA